ncbi:MAG: hypothetical protein IIT65_15100 [Lachnospiraceae bacterium]|nr:hypothetical protein [Lachnospiraceae bacterium]
MKKKFLTVVTALSLVAATAIPTFAATVWYKGSAVSWDYGRSLKVYSYSNVQSSVYEHSATANTTSSGWKLPCDVAKAKQFVGTKTATAYWNCRG